MREKKSEFRMPHLFSRFKSIRSSILFSFVMVTVISLMIFLIFSLRLTEDNLLENSTEYTQQLVEQIKYDIDSYIEYMENISQMVVNNRDLEQYLFSENEDVEAKKRLQNQFDSVLSSRSDIINIVVLGKNGRNLINDGTGRPNEYVDIGGLDWYQKTMKAGGKAVVSTSHVQSVVADSYRWVVTLSKALVDEKTGKIKGIFFVDLNYESIRQLCEKTELGKKGYVFILDKDGGIVYHPKQQLLYGGLMTEEIEKVLAVKNDSFVIGNGEDKKLYSVKEMETTEWRISGVSYTREFMTNRREIQTAYAFIAFLLIGLGTMFAYVLSMELTRPLKNLEKSMQVVEKGDFSHAIIEPEGNNEITSLGRSFNIMLMRIQNLMKQNVQEQKEKRKNELRALQSQINPHFLYNTLDSIIWMAESGKNQEVVKMTSALAKLLRRSISNENELVSVRDEVEYTRMYLTIQKMRYRDQMEYEISVDEDIMDEKIVKLVIQPLVENAIYHGIKYVEEDGMISITGRREDGDIIICVRDNGPGMDAEMCRSILEKRKVQSKANHVGVYNVHNRLKLYYGPKYGVSYESEKGYGTSAYITIPAVGLEEEDEE